MWGCGVTKKQAYQLSAARASSLLGAKQLNATLATSTGVMEQHCNYKQYAWDQQEPEFDMEEIYIE